MLACSGSAAFGQRTPVRRTLTVNPPRVMLGRPIVLTVQGASQGAQYRFVATMTATGSGDRPAAGCPNNLSLGSGANVSWTPLSGTYRLTAYGPQGRETDTLSVTYAVPARRVMLATQTAQGSSATLVLRTDDLGPGHKYHWSMQYTTASATGGGTAQAFQSQPWTAQTNGPTATYPSTVPASASIKAAVGIHRGNSCEIIATGSLPNQ